ncbi:hypothetical protein F2Q69_00047683 [Brassica cretica]|uniref:Uncharacterized protein n=1 Tax=Brassica cretica TaxID=69181 RepID=A0A8S9PRQ7_BRACR|nr:hypothetical protein F2Q69_00047683 [Brassica cretica]
MPVNVLSRLAVLQSKNLPLVFRGESCVVLLGFVVKCHIPVLPKRDGGGPPHSLLSHFETRAKPCRFPERSENPSRQGFSFSCLFRSLLADHSLFFFADVSLSSLVVVRCTLEPSHQRSSMNRFKSGSKSLRVFFLDLITSDGNYPFICRSGSWKALSFRSASSLFFIRRSKAKVELLLCCVVNVRRPGILKTHCFGLMAGDKCHDIADHFSYAGSECHKWYQGP